MIDDYPEAQEDGEQALELALNLDPQYVKIVRYQFFQNTTSRRRSTTNNLVWDFTAIVGSSDVNQTLANIASLQVCVNSYG